MVQTSSGDQDAIDAAADAVPTVEQQAAQEKAKRGAEGTHCSLLRKHRTTSFVGG